MKTYTIQRGDSLFKIAKTFYGDGELYSLLAVYNHLRNPNAIEVGQVLKIPPVEELRAPQNPLGEWHNYRNGSIYWRVTKQGVEIKGQGLIKDARFTKTAKRIWDAYRQPILTAAQKHQAPIPVIIATIVTESGGVPDKPRYEPAFYDAYIKNQPPWTENPYYHEPKRIASSYGLMQIMYTTAVGVGFQGAPEELNDPTVNLEFGAAYIASPFQQKEHDWDPPKIACAYNAGKIRATTANPWGMHHTPRHLDRWIPSYNAAIEVVGAEYLEIPSASTSVATAPAQPTIPSEGAAPAQHVTLRFLFPKAAETAWKPVIIDLFKHQNSGLSDPISFTVYTPSYTPAIGYKYDVSKVSPGVYDFVFTDAASQSVLYDVADVRVDHALAVVDLRKSRALSAGAAEEGLVARIKNVVLEMLSKLRR